MERSTYSTKINMEGNERQPLILLSLWLSDSIHGPRQLNFDFSGLGLMNADSSSHWQRQ